MRTIKQGANTGDCVAAVIAMITAQSIKYVHSYFRRNGDCGFTDMEAAKYLLEHGYILGGVGCHGESINIKTMKADLGILDLSETFGYVIVKSKFYKHSTHAVLYDPRIKMIRDPSPETPARTELSAYKIKEWFPVSVGDFKPPTKHINTMEKIK